MTRAVPGLGTIVDTPEGWVLTAPEGDLKVTITVTLARDGREDPFGILPDEAKRLVATLAAAAIRAARP